MRSRGFHAWIIFVCLCLAGCEPAVRQEKKPNWLLINFKENAPVTYHFVSDRQITIDLTGGESERKSRPQKIAEQLDLVITYTPTDVDPFGLTHIVAKCRSAKVTRLSVSGRPNAKDAMENLAGKTYTFSLSPTGEIVDDADLNRIIRELGDTAFDRSANRRIKNPDMIIDFIAMQWHLWDSTSTIEEPLTGMEPGQTWQVRQWIPWPAPIPNMPMRLTTYKLDDFITEEGQPKKARLTSTYTLADPVKKQFPPPYEGMFQMRGIMGFLRSYNFVALDGSGTQIFNMEEGMIEREEQHFVLDVTAAFLLPLGDSKPVLKVDQNILIEQIPTP